MVLSDLFEFKAHLKDNWLSGMMQALLRGIRDNIPEGAQNIFFTSFSSLFTNHYDKDRKTYKPARLFRLENPKKNQTNAGKANVRARQMPTRISNVITSLSQIFFLPNVFSLVPNLMEWCNELAVDAGRNKARRQWNYLWCRPLPGNQTIKLLLVVFPAR